jgi:hypothetical protein
MSRSEPEPHPVELGEGEFSFDVVLPPLSVAAVAFQFAAPDRG